MTETPTLGRRFSPPQTSGVPGETTKRGKGEKGQRGPPALSFSPFLLFSSAYEVISRQIATHAGSATVHAR
jgi:hypothetical protein